MAVPVCPRCAEPGEQPLTCQRCGWRWYANPRPSAGAIVLRRTVAPDGEEGEPSFLLLRRDVEPGRGAWDLPAGYLDPYESPEDAARRETLEEAGLEVELVELVGIYTSRDANAVSAVYIAYPADPNAEVRLDRESSDFAWVERRHADEWLPRMAFLSMARAVADWAAGVRRLPAAARRE
jgi:ADP-ribose pyrophosphatase YjhB (NUDIX family)